VRIISGLYRGRRLQASSGLDVRPTSDRLRETLFNILTPHIRGARFLDLCAGSGAIGIEALSRHAAHITFVDQSRRACDIIKTNLQTLKIGDEARILNREALAAIRQLDSEGENFDIIYFDPPYASELYEPVLARLAASQIVGDDTIIIVEHRKKVRLEPEYGKWKLYREVKQGESVLIFFRQPQPS
jgi:16S rRNA (guanine(966)-N(2))-methyltransferase RsmD